MKIGIVDYGMGNLGSIRNMLGRIGVDATITSDPDELRSADKLILPGVGAFDMAIENLEARHLINALNEIVMERGVPVLGICLGMQLFSLSSEEGKLPGLGWIQARTRRFDFSSGPVNLPVPHMGWNYVTQTRCSELFQGLAECPRFYFVHSYHVVCEEAEDVIATARYGVEFHAAVRRRNIAGAQFHPEKSHRYGMTLLRNFAEQVW